MPENYNPNLPPPPQQPIVDPYGFITSPQKQEVRSAPLGVKDPFLQKLILLVGGAAVLLIIVVIVMNVFFSTKSNTDQLLTLAQRQQEIVRVVSANSSELRNQSNINFAANAQISIQSDQNQMLALLTKQGVKTDPKILALKLSADTDTLLATSKSTNTLDDTFKQVLENELNTYISELQAANKTASADTTKQLIAAEFQAANLLLLQLKAQ